MKTIPVLTKNELDYFLSIQDEIDKLKENSNAIKSKLDQILVYLIQEWHFIEGTHYREILYVDSVSYFRSGTILFNSNWGKVYITLNDLLNPEKFLEDFKKVKQDEEMAKAESFIKKKREQAEKEEENEKLKSLGFDTENIEELKKQVLRLYNDKYE